jgi:hypothetical protein
MTIGPYKPIKAKPYGDQWSLAEVQVKGGHVISLAIKASPALADWLTNQMRDNGFLTLRNDKESISIAAKHVVAFKLTLMTTGE